MNSAWVRAAPASAMTLALWVGLWSVSPGFRAPANLLALSREISIIGLLACGEAVVLVSGGIDLSPASILVLAGAAAAAAAMAGVPPMVCALLSVACGALAGAVNGTMVARLRIPAVVATLITFGLYRASVSLVTHSQEIGPLPTGLVSFGLGAGPVALLGAVAGALAIGASYTRPGRRLYALGGNAEACRVAGIPVRSLRMAAFILSGMAAGVAALAVMGGSGALQAHAAAGYELDAIAACAVGGVSLQGGRGTVLGTVMGAALLRSVSDGLLLLSIPIDWYRMVIAAVLLLSAAGDRWVSAGEATA